MDEKIVNQFITTGKFLKEQSFKLEICELYLNTSEGTYGVSKIKDLSKIKESDIKKVDAKIFPKGKNAIIFSITPFSKQFLRTGMAFKAPLDDFAQIVGTSFSYIRSNGVDPLLNYELQLALKNSNASYICESQDENTHEYHGYQATCGRDLMEAATTLVVLEKGAKVSILGTLLTDAKPVGLIQGTIQHKFYEKKYSKNSLLGFKHNEKLEYSKDELAKRKEIVSMGKKLLETGLVERTWGNISVRLDDKYMLVTPSGIEYTELFPEDIVKVEIETLKYSGNLKPTSEKRLHSLVYQNRPEVNAVIHTHSDYLSAYAASHEGLEDTPCSVYGMSGTKFLAKRAIEALGKDSTSVIIANHGFLAVGSNLDEALNICKSKEELAKKNLEIKID